MKLELTTIVSEQIMDRIREHTASDGLPAALMATGAVLVVEVIHEDGDPYLHTFRPDETTAWAAVGMAEMAKQWLLDDTGDDE